MIYFNYKLIKLKRNKLKLSQSSLAKKCNLTREHISEIERGKTTPRVDTLLKIANALKVKVGYFFE